MECFVETNWHTGLYVTGTLCMCCIAGTAATFVKLGRAQINDASGAGTMLFSRRLSHSVTQSQDGAGELPLKVGFCKQVSGICERLMKQVGIVFLVLGYFIYPASNAIFFQTFNCQYIDSVSYLRNDLSIECSDPAHKTATNFALFMVVVFSVGLPLLYLHILLPHRQGFLAASGRCQANLNSVRTLRFFYMDYKVIIPQMYTVGVFLDLSVLR
jgi:hypothetical protein